MAKAVEFRTLTPRDSRDDLLRKLDNAPAAHAEALLEGYDLVQRLHDKGVLAILNGMLSAGDDVVERIVDLVSSREAVAALRLALIFGDVLTSIDPDEVKKALALREGKKDPTLWQLAKQATAPNTRRGLAAAIRLLTLFGSAVQTREIKEESKPNHG